MVPRRLRADHRLPEEPRRLLLVAPLVLIAVVTTVDILAPPSVHLGPFLVAAPAVTASFAGPRITGCVGVLAVLAQAVVAMVRTTLIDLNHIIQLIALILISAIVTLFAYWRERREEEMTRLRSVAKAAQSVVLRPLPHQIGPLRIASVYLSAEREAQLGGDLYAAARTALGTRIVIGDVRGKGLEAVGDAALLLGAFRGAAHRQADLAELVSFLEGTVSSDLDDPAAPEDKPADFGEAFVTAAVLDVLNEEAALHLVNCGHPPPLLLGGGGVRLLEVSRPAPPLGLTEFLDTDLAPQRFAFEADDIVLLYTDGVIEARDGDGTFYPLMERVEHLISTRLAGPEALLSLLREDLLRHAGGHLGDDAALVAIQRLPG
ncbi:PP2C family protein-serine/threonine phosphatase [Streptomyces sp. NPDC052023]|uniref:PP2C family protein-serine/threonine phosphatase n=1 Tax=Streptomyces sp. NPDC052023 TaxID=3365681 RepID=UPI0037D063DF